MKQCTTCQTRYPDSAQFCGGCGQPLAPLHQGAMPERRGKGKGIAILVTTIVLVIAVSIGAFIYWKNTPSTETIKGLLLAYIYNRCGEQGLEFSSFEVKNEYQETRDGYALRVYDGTFGLKKGNNGEFYQGKFTIFITKRGKEWVCYTDPTSITITDGSFIRKEREENQKNLARQQKEDETRKAYRQRAIKEVELLMGKWIVRCGSSCYFRYMQGLYEAKGLPECVMRDDGQLVEPQTLTQADILNGRKPDHTVWKGTVQLLFDAFRCKLGDNWGEWQDKRGSSFSITLRTDGTTWDFDEGELQKLGSVDCSEVQ